MKPNWKFAIYSNPLICVAPLELAKIWGEFILCYLGKNGYGGSTAEIYSYRFQPYNPSVHIAGYEHTDLYKRESEEHYARSANALCALLYEFCTEYDCDAEIDGLTVDEWCRKISCGEIVYKHHCHVRIIKS